MPGGEIIKSNQFPYLNEKNIKVLQIDSVGRGGSGISMREKKINSKLDKISQLLRREATMKHKELWSLLGHAMRFFVFPFNRSKSVSTSTTKKCELSSLVSSQYNNFSSSLVRAAWMFRLLHISLSHIASTRASSFCSLLSEPLQPHSQPSSSSLSRLFVFQIIEVEWEKRRKKSA